jgi:hypothetical protein
MSSAAFAVSISTSSAAFAVSISTSSAAFAVSISTSSAAFAVSFYVRSGSRLQEVWIKILYFLISRSKTKKNIF